MARIPPLEWSWLGRQPYRPVHARQRALREDLLAGRGEPALWLLEHEPVITLGRRADEAALAISRAELARRGVAVERIERGGEATFHGPGQLVGYPVLPLEAFGLTVPAFVAHMEGAMIELVARCGLQAHRREGYPGVWVGRHKIGAVGIHLARMVSIHGFALNLTLDPEPFRWIVPCGIRPEVGTVSSVAALGGDALEPEAAAPLIARSLQARLGASGADR